MRDLKEQTNITAMEYNLFWLRISKTVAHQWWFLALILLLQLIPPFTSRSYDLRQWAMVNAYILTHPVKASLTGLFPVFQVTPLILIALLLIIGNKARRIFSAYVVFSYVGIALLQNISISDRYGFAICTANLLTFIILAGMWSWETIFPKNDFTAHKHPFWKYWIVLLALLPFWEPVHPFTLQPDFNPAYILTSGAGLSFCLVTPLYLALLMLYFPRVNKSLLVATGFVGVIISLGNMALEFVIFPIYWWIGILHIPLFIISLVSLWLSVKEIIAQESLAPLDPRVSYEVSNP